jgi:4-hydroxy-2-oxoglutarate aldolase
MANRVKLGGVYAPITTPFNARGDLDAEAAAANCRAVIAAGMHGIVVCGSTGEAPLLDEGERATLLGAVRAAVPSSCQVLMGIGAESTRQTVERAKTAAAIGADAVLCVAPHYFGAGAMNDDALRAHYRAVADASPVPVVLYTIPKYMHFALSAALVAELATHANVIGIKDSSGDPVTFAGYLPSQSAKFTVLTGNATQFLAALRSGARGGILAAADFAPAQARAIFDAHTAGDSAEADAVQARFGPLGTEIVAKGVSNVKAACDAVGLAGGNVRPPLRDIDAAARAKVASLLAAAEVGPVSARLALAH